MIQYKNILYVKAVWKNKDFDTSEKIIEYAKQYVNTKFFDWEYIPKFSIKKLLKGIYLYDGFKSVKSWLKWYKHERTYYKEDHSEYYDEMEKVWKSNPLKLGPPVLTVQNGMYGIDDGWHRIGISFKLGMDHIPIILGTPKVV